VSLCPRCGASGGGLTSHRCHEYSGERTRVTTAHDPAACIQSWLQSEAAVKALAGALHQEGLACDDHCFDWSGERDGMRRAEGDPRHARTAAALLQALRATK